MEGSETSFFFRPWTVSGNTDFPSSKYLKVFPINIHCIDSRFKDTFWLYKMLQKNILFQKLLRIPLNLMNSTRITVPFFADCNI